MKDKVTAVYALRSAAEAHGRAEAALDLDNCAVNRDLALDTKVELEAATAEAIESCHYCGRKHDDDHPHSRARVTHKPDGVIELRFEDPKPAGDTACEEEPPA